MICNRRPSITLARLVEGFGDRLLLIDLPALPAARRHETVAFAGRRIDGMPAPMRLGVMVVAGAVAGWGRLIGRRRVARILAGRPLPVVGDYVRLVRSLSYAYVWETWPSTAADGAPARPARGAHA